MSHVDVSDGSILASDIQPRRQIRHSLNGDVRHCRIRGRILAGFILGYYKTCP